MKAYSEEHLNTCAEILKNDAEYQKKAKGYDSYFQIIVTPEPDKGVTETYGLGYYLPDFHDIWMGVREDADITLTAPYSIHHQILLGKLNAVKAIMTRKAKIKGPMAKVLKYNSATNHFVKVLQSVPVEFDGDFEPLVAKK